MEGEDKSDLNQHEVAEGHSREHRRGFVCRTVSPKSPMGARDQGLITCGLERTRSLSLRKKYWQSSFCCGLGDLEWEGKCKMFAEGQLGW